MLTTLSILKDHLLAPAKSGVGICTPECLQAIPDAPASFLSSAPTHTKIMVSWAGEPKGSPVSCNAGSANPVQFTASEFCTSCGEYFSLLQEIAAMAVYAHARLKTFIFAAVERANLKSARPVMLHITAATERAARQTVSRQYVLYCVLIS